MPNIIDSTLWEFLAAISILILLSSPFLFLFAALSVTRSLRRIAVANETVAKYYAGWTETTGEQLGLKYTPTERRVSNSALGR
jgi:hypothetical protein